MGIEITGNFSDEPIHYVYIHKRNDTGCVFYVGKGKHKRAWSKGSRNKHWKHIVDKHGYSVEIIKDCLTETEAFELEILTIEGYGLDNLVNLTIGGHTSTGYEHTPETRQLQKEQSLKRKETNPEWYKGCLERIKILNEQQKADPSWFKKLGKATSERYHALSDIEKIAYRESKTAWLKDKEKVRVSREKAIKTRNSPAWKEAMSDKTRKWWDSLSHEQRQAEIFKRTEATRKAAQYRTGVISTSTTYLVNRSVVVPTIKKCIDFFGSGLVSAVVDLRNKSKNLILFKGFVFEVYDKSVHGDVVNTDLFSLVPLPCLNWNTRTAIKASDGRIFLSISHAAKSFGDKQTDSTADWISRCHKNGVPAMGLTWSRPTHEECENEILRLLREQKNIKEIQHG